MSGWVLVKYLQRADCYPCTTINVSRLRAECVLNDYTQTYNYTNPNF